MKKAWLRTQLGDLSTSIDYGHTASARAEPIGPKFLRITDIQEDAVHWEDVPHCECTSKDEQDLKLTPGDIVFARTGATTGKSHLIRECPERAVFASYLIRVRVRSNVFPGYLAHFFRTRDYWSQISRSSTGTAQAGVNATSLRRLEIPLPPLDEQRRIAAILDHADALRAKRRASLAKLDSLTQSIFLEMFGEPLANEKGWPKQRMHEVVTLVSSGVTPLGGSTVYKDQGILFIRSQNVLMNEFDFSDIAYIDAEMHSRMRRTWVKRGDVLLNITGASIGRVHHYDGENDCANVNQHVCIIRPRPDYVRPAFLSRLISLPSYQRHILGRNSGATRQAFNFAQIRAFEFPLPPLKLQLGFETRLDRVTGLASRAAASRENVNSLLASLQLRAFRGEL